MAKIPIVPEINDFRYPVATALAGGVAMPSDGAPYILGAALSDPDGIYNVSTGIFTASISGYYEFSAQIQIGTTSLAGQFYNIGIYKNGGLVALQTNRSVGGVVDQAVDLSPIIILLNQGETASVRKQSTNWAGLSASGNTSHVTCKLVRRL